MIFLNGVRSRLKFTNFLGFVPGNFYLYKLAFTHSSVPLKLKNGSVVNNERLEFLGDAILQAIVSDVIYKQFPNKNEGFLSKARSIIVQRETLNLIAVNLGIPQLLKININMEDNTLNPYGNALEALLGAIYVDKGYDKAKRYVLEKILTDSYLYEKILTNHQFDYKSQILEWGQKNKKRIVFSVEEIPDNNNGIHFFSILKIGNRKAGSGFGISKKEAEQNAAEKAYKKIENEKEKT